MSALLSSNSAIYLAIKSSFSGLPATFCTELTLANNRGRIGRSKGKMLGYLVTSKLV
jgi:hypothetical protein